MPAFATADTHPTPASSLCTFRSPNSHQFVCVRAGLRETQSKPNPSHLLRRSLAASRPNLRPPLPVICHPNPKTALRLIKVLMGLRSEYESVRAALLHRSPLPSLDAAIQEILFEEKRLDINLSKHSDVVLANTYSPLEHQAHFVRILISSSSSALVVSPGNRWLLDSACCNHMTSNYSLINTPSPAKSLPPIYAADGNCMNITHIGTINTPSLNLPHTYCVPNLTFNLVSVGQLCDLGLTVYFSPNGCQVQDPQTRQTIGTGRKVGRLFELISLQVPPPSSISALVTDSIHISGIFVLVMPLQKNCVI
ncbi:Retrovirus-related Pol polyprotein from transposon TNT 1-94 [Cucumis melo var. makuwa]|uniref:Retrovirus-related Pol polyprotein from transposon TNT 1-94 n=1 Tax=Cucumis melo var. makuwa TaxID=1194695 RepID=A0A5A7T7N0_CUCMM|nr:Retrovirus-related Pol polyprotein from transposon TNT 1-94 [Cucumis melo var. makuwa]TYJ97532.1 Retrovirus-related Pol polyprotein from transposon TNT 1-94 [Cucumis melo var. makuwa]